MILINEYINELNDKISYINKLTMNIKNIYDTNNNNDNKIKFIKNKQDELKRYYIDNINLDKYVKIIKNDIPNIDNINNKNINDILNNLTQMENNFNYITSYINIINNNYLLLYLFVINSILSFIYRYNSNYYFCVTIMSLLIYTFYINIKYTTDNINNICNQVLIKKFYFIQYYIKVINIYKSLNLMIELFDEFYKNENWKCYNIINDIHKISNRITNNVNTLNNYNNIIN